MKTYAITAVICGLAAYLTLRRSRPKCGAGATFARMTMDEAETRFGRFSSWPDIAEQIEKYGGTCVRSGVVSDAGTRPVDHSNGGLWDGEDPVLILHPWQLP